jgi:biotin carboxyl carrier protein
MSSDKPKTPPLLVLLDLARRSRYAENDRALQFILVNQTHELVSYITGVLWTEDEGIVMQSGVSHIEKNAPYILWLSELAKQFIKEKEPTRIEPSMLKADDVQMWEKELPSHAIWFPISHQTKKAGLLLCREEVWTDQDIGMLNEWIDTWSYAWYKMHAPSLHGELNRLWHSIKSWLSPLEKEAQSNKKIQWTELLSHHWKSIHQSGIKHYFLNTIWNNRHRRLLFILTCIFLFPVRLTILAPAELVPAHPAVIRVPIEGVVDEFFVLPNQKVTEGQPLFKLDLTALNSRFQIAQQETQVASTEYRQSALQSLNDPKSRSQLVPQEGRASERKLEADYVKELLEKAQIKSPKSGIVLFDDPSEWIGKPVAAGERVMIVTDENDAEIEAWVALGNAINLPKDAKITMYLNTSPFSPIDGKVRYMGYEAIQRPDSNYAYRLRAHINSNEHNTRIGLKGTAKISGDYVPTIYWIFRKPIAVLRQFAGI